MRNTAPLIQACLGHLRTALGPNLPVDLEQAARGAHDFFLQIGTQPPLNLTAEAKARPTTRNQAGHIILQMKPLAGEALLFADWIPEPIAEEFRQAGLFFVDAQGNIFIRKPPHVVVDIRGKKPDRPLKAETGRLIQPGGLKVVHYLLTHPAALGDPMRTIAEGAGVGLATVHAVMRELKRRQWILPAAKGKRRFGNPKELVELFVRGYGLKLRPGCLLGRYRHKTRTPQDILDGFAQRLAETNCRWAVTGGMAAREMTHYLEPDAITLFVDDEAKEKLKQEPMLRDDAGGNVTLLHLFGKAAAADKLQGPWQLATPLLVYAELLEAGGAREAETAKMIYERFIEPAITHG